MGNLSGITIYMCVRESVTQLPYCLCCLWINLLMSSSIPCKFC